MNTVVTVTLYDGNNDILSGVMELCRDYEKMLSRTVEGSDIFNLNNAGGNNVLVSPQTAELINISLDISQKSDGAFDVTTAALTELWDVTNKTSAPGQDLISEAIKTVDYKKIKIDGQTVSIPLGTKLDLGGIAKGYIADKAAEYLKNNGVTNAIINLGGNLLILGDNNGEPYSVGVQKPFDKNGEIVLSVNTDNKSVVTSGVYQRYYTQNGKIYHHIIDPKSGYPTDNDIDSVTIIADSSAVADGLSTACLVLGIEKGTALASQYGAEVIFIESNGKITLTDGLLADYSTTVPNVRLK